MHGYGLCLWRLRRCDDAMCVFERMLWLIRFLIEAVRAGKTWEELEEAE